MSAPMSKFWEKGIRFECVPGCRKCCEIPGLVFVHESEIERIAAFLKITPEKFRNDMLKEYCGDVYHLDYPEDEPCMFADDAGCAIYEARPLQCSSFPFWPENMREHKEWNSLEKTCPGIGKGELHSQEKILGILAVVSQKLEL